MGNYTMKLSNETDEIDILLSTYNGEQYLEELLESLFCQTYTNWSLIIRDDFSGDKTQLIINQYTKAYPDKIRCIDNHEGRIGPCQSFAKLLTVSTAPYIMFCDQDDVWLPDKIQKMLYKMKQVESQNESLPVLIHSDLIVVNRELSLISNSFWKYQKLRPELNQINYLMVQNNVTGCATIINKHLQQICLPVPTEAVMHDWWIALIAAIKGKIEYINEPTILYRQHEDNDTGAKKYTPYYFFFRLLNLKESISSNKKIIDQAIALGKFCCDINEEYTSMSDNQRVIKEFSSLLRRKRLSRMATLFKYKIRKFGLLRTIGFIMVLLLMKKKHTTLNGPYHHRGA